MSFLDKLFRFRAKPHVGKKESGEKSASSVVAPSPKAAPVSALPRSNFGRASKVLLGAVTTEKTTRGTKEENSYTFIVSRFASKGEVKEAVRALYGVTPIRVNMVRVRGKAVRFGQVQGAQKDWKKAMVSLKQGESISLAGEVGS